MPKERARVTPAVYLMLIKNKQILLSRRYNTGFCDGEYSFPAGHVEGNETLIQATVRETKEEIGVVLDPKDLELVHAMHRRGPVDERADFFFTVKKWSGEPKNMEPDKCDDLGWFELSNLPKNTIPYIKQAINHVLQKRFYSEHGW